MHRQQPAVY